jgi:hypothetical protein
LIRSWLRGRTKAIPDWVPVLLAAEEWSIAPWRIEEEATQEWWQRWRALYEERANAPKPGQKRNGNGVVSDD